MGRKKQSLTSTQIGTIAENLVANELMIESRGRLSAFVPVADDEGIDLLVYDKKTGRDLPIQIKARTGTIKKPRKEEKGNIVHFEIREAAVKNEKYAYFLGVLLAEDLRITVRAWLIPMKDVRKVLNKQKKYGKYIMRASKSLSSRDKFSAYRCENVSEVSQRLLALFDSKRGREGVCLILCGVKVGRVVFVRRVF